MQFHRNNRQDRDNETAVPIIEPLEPHGYIVSASTWNYDPAIYARSLSPRGEKRFLCLFLTGKHRITRIVLKRKRVIPRNKTNSFPGDVYELRLALHRHSLLRFIPL